MELAAFWYRMQIVQAQLFLPDRLVAGSLRVQAGRIAAIRRGIGWKGCCWGNGEVVNLRGDYLVPGFIDLHVHGALGRDTMEASEAAFRTITEYHLTGGTTSLALTTVTATPESILKVLQAVKPWHNRSLGGSRIVGVHVEGPFLSPERSGAHDAAQIRRPRPAEWRRYLRFGSLVTQMTLAPEAPGALALIKALRRNGSIASAGHTSALEPEFKPAVEAGLNQVTHTFNCLSAATKQGPVRVPGVLECALVEQAVRCELIADGCHVAPTLMKLLYLAKGRDGICLITDAMAGAGMAPGTVYQAGGANAPMARVTRDTAVLADASGLAGSTLTMIEAVRRAVQLGGFPLVDAVRMASLNPARQLGRQQEFGSLETGKRADLVWVDRQFRVRAVWLDGELRFWA
jgi:N-acetylglucosamine-6-phosphate deacetylase